MLKVVCLLLIIIPFSCYPEKIKFTVYDETTIEQQNAIQYAFDFFNEKIANCQAVSLSENHTSRGHYHIGNLIPEITISYDWDSCLESNPKYKTRGCTLGFDKDIVVLDDHLFYKSGLCEFMHNRLENDDMYFCDYRIVSVMHELGHAFGLEHSSDENDIMFRGPSEFISIDALPRFQQQLYQHTKICNTERLNKNKKEY